MFLFGMMLCSSWVMFMVSVGVLLVWLRIEFLLMFLVVCSSWLGVIMKFIWFIVCVVFFVVVFSRVVGEFMVK